MKNDYIVDGEVAREKISMDIRRIRKIIQVDIQNERPVLRQRAEIKPRRGKHRVEQIAEMRRGYQIMAAAGVFVARHAIDHVK